MKKLKIFIHIAAVALAIFLFLGTPSLIYKDAIKSIFSSDSSENATTGATMILPDAPSGEFVVYINKSAHTENMEKWRAFLSGEEVIIFDDIKCLVFSGDENGIQMAERLMGELPQNQMTVKSENATLLASKTEAGIIDFVVVSKEMAEALKLSYNIDGVETIIIKGER